MLPARAGLSPCFISPRTDCASWGRDMSAMMPIPLLPIHQQDWFIFPLKISMANLS